MKIKQIDIKLMDAKQMDVKQRVIRTGKATQQTKGYTYADSFKGKPRNVYISKGFRFRWGVKNDL